MIAYNKKNPGTIDLVEDCLEQIHRCRKAALMARARKFREKEERLRQSNPYVLGSSYDRNKKSNYDEEEEQYDEDDEILKDLSSKFTAPAPKVVPLAPPDYSVAYNSKEPSAEDDADRIAQDAYVEFTTEITAWLNNHSKDVIEDDDIRADFADHLVHFYLSSNLDKLPATKKVVEIRKSIAGTVEEFASSGKIKLNASIMKLSSSIRGSFSEKTPTSSSSALGKPAGKVSPKNIQNFEEDPVGKGQDKTKNSENQKPNVKNNKSAVNTADGNSAVSLAEKKAIKVADPNEKKKTEKQKIKEQYEAYMSMKKNVEVHPDNDTVKQYSDLNDDIQSLISSIQGTRTK